jgi:ribosomal protein S19
MEVSTEMMTLVRVPQIVPEMVGTIKVFNGGKTLPWTLL